MLLFLSLLPFLFFVGLLFWKKTSLLKISLLSLLLTLILTVFYWRIMPFYLWASLAKGLFVALDIFIIIFGAVLFLEILKATQIINNLCRYLGSLSRDYRVQVILLAWFLENFIEGTAGFGTPAAIAGPLLVGLGLAPITAAVVALLGNSASVAFGAAGTPIRIGFAGLDIGGVPFYAAFFGLVGFIVPTFMLWVITRNKLDQKKQFFEALPFAVWAGLAFVVPALATVFLGQEFPSILGAVLGIAIILATIRLKIFMPKTSRSFENNVLEKPTQPLWKVIFPYALLILLLLAGKFLLGGRGITFSFGISHTFNFFNPGFAFLLAAIPVLVFIAKDLKLAGKSLKIALKRTIEPFLVIIAMSALVQLMINSGQNASGLPSSLQFLAANLKTGLLPFISPFVGAFGSFLTGSATVSNIMFGGLLTYSSRLIGVSTAVILGLAVAGAAAGNMIAIADILTTEAVMGLKEKTREVLKGVIIPCLIYILLIGVFGLILVRFF